MKLQFSKYQGTGNDFILIDNRQAQHVFTRAQVAELCNRRFGIGADGLILLNAHSTLDFEMKNYNSDGGECSMCGNGGRALIQFAFDQGVTQEQYRFMAIDGEHEALLKNNKVELKMQNINDVRETPVGYAMDTGSPHLVVDVKDLLNFDVVKEGRKLRNSSLFLPAGINVNFVEKRYDHLFIRTYERGVEDETLSCGTGAIAAAIASILDPSLDQTLTYGQKETAVQCQGGRLTIRFEKKTRTQFEEIWLIGEAKKSFEGQV
ncbi:MAG: diaminopimelate epimerase [Bdellovibrionales bacterium]|nr:diaminopimelate epimerase [Oligoflexia bacterium]